MGRGSVPSSPQTAARGWPKSALLQPQPACPGAWAAAGLRRRAKGQGSRVLLLFLLLQLLPPAAMEKRARAPQWRPPGQRSRSLPCPALPCSAALSGAAGGAGSQRPEPRLWLARRLPRAGVPPGQPGPALALPSPGAAAAAAAAAEAPCPRRTTSSGRCPAGVLAPPADVLPRATAPAWRHSRDK